MRRQIKVLVILLVALSSTSCSQHEFGKSAQTIAPIQRSYAGGSGMSDMISSPAQRELKVQNSEEVSTSKSSARVMVPITRSGGSQMAQHFTF